ncbi:MAG: dTDP-glucose 4,6-dehydratase [Armatimonadetes bacterium]|nr:dTDP-glucose 4,6-dehydratase [Armatimonadota bacterium]
MKRLLVTGGAGFIGSNFVRWSREAHPGTGIVVLDALTYAGQRENLEGLDGVEFVEGDIRDGALVERLMAEVDAVVHFAAESHVDRSILEAETFISTNVYGTYVLLQAAHKTKVGRFLHVSTDEVYGSIVEGASTERDALAPSSPYAASKAASDMMALAHRTTFGTPVVITRSSNNFGPYQYPEKLIPLFLTNAMQDIPLPLYGDGLNMRDWLYVEDNCEGIDVVLHRGELGEIYNIGAGNERTNREITDAILGLLGKPSSLVRYVEDRLGHDRRYSVDISKARALGWRPRHDFEEALGLTVSWYQTNEPWWRRIKERGLGFQNFYASYYGKRIAEGESR